MNGNSTDVYIPGAVFGQSSSSSNTGKENPLPTTPFLQVLACAKSFTNAWLLYMKVVRSITSWFSLIKMSLSRRAIPFAPFCKGILLY